MRLKIAPSILSADFARLGEEVQQVEAAGADQVHVDVMDGHFVPNLSMGPIVVDALRRVTRLPLDVHLMITQPGKHIDAFVRAGASHVSFHLEAEGDMEAMARGLREKGVGAGLVVNPETPVERALGLLPGFDMILVMTVHPGFSGQGFLAENLEKVRAVRALESKLLASGRRGRALDIEVDGGIDERTAVLARDAGANVFVAGSAIFRHGEGDPPPGEALRALRRRLEGTARESEVQGA
jgi:ribulose-phosphate 3-epimerase